MIFQLNNLSERPEQVAAAAAAAAAAAIDGAIEMEIERGQRAIAIEIRTRSEESPGDALAAAAIEMEIERGQRAIEIEIREFVRNNNPYRRLPV